MKKKSPSNAEAKQRMADHAERVSVRDSNRSPYPIVSPQSASEKVNES